MPAKKRMSGFFNGSDPGNAARKKILFRSAAAFTKVIGDISSRPLLTRKELINGESGNDGMVIVGLMSKKNN